MRTTLQRLTLALLALWLPLAGAEAPSEIPGADPAINRPYQSPDYDQWTARFERPGREIYDHRRQIVALVNPRPGMDIADVGAGTGLFTRLLAAEVGPGGTVYAVDISGEFVENVLRTAREQGLENVVGIVNSQTGTGLDPGSVDLVFLSDTYHHFERPAAMLRSIHQALRPGGQLVVIDFERVPGLSSPWVLDHVRAGKEVFAREIQDAGFRLLGEEPIMRYNYFLRFEKVERR